MDAQTVAAQDQAQAPAANYAQIHYLDHRTYDEVFQILTEYTGFVFGEAQKPEPLSSDKLGLMLTIFSQNCLKKGVPPDAAAPSGAKCMHKFTRGKDGKAGTYCGDTAKYKGIEGLPKCSSHKNSKPSKDSTDPVAMGAGANAQTFSYSAHQGKGKIAPQSLTSIQASIREQTEPAKLSLEKAPGDDARIFNRETGLVFEQREGGTWVAVGIMQGPITAKLTTMEVHVCYGNQWAWDQTCVDDPNAKDLGHPLVAGHDHPLLAGAETTALVANKIRNIQANNSTITTVQGV